MKKNIIIVLFIVTIILLLCDIYSNPYDINKDGKVDSKDLLDLRIYLLNE